MRARERSSMALLWCSALAVMACVGLPADDVPVLHVPTLKIGDPAPVLKPSGWLNGEPVESFAPGTIYVVECWETLCGPCRRAMPRLSELNTRFRDQGVVFIGLDVWEQDQAEVPRFMDGDGKMMNYRVALDAQGVNAAAWLLAAGRDGLPCTFVVDRAGKIAWIGHSVYDLEQALEGMVNGSFDSHGEAARQTAKQAKLTDLAQRFDAGLKASDPAVVRAIVVQIAATDRRSGSEALMGAFTYFFVSKHNYPAAQLLAMDAIGRASESYDTIALEDIARSILGVKASVDDHQIDLAIKVALRADELEEHRLPSVLDALAQAYFLKGDRQHAIEAEKAAISAAGENEKYRQPFEAALARFQPDPVPK